METNRASDYSLEERVKKLEEEVEKLKEIIKRKPLPRTL